MEEGGGGKRAWGREEGGEREREREELGKEMDIDMEMELSYIPEFGVDGGKGTKKAGGFGEMVRLQ